MDQVGIEAPCLYALRVLARGVESAAEHVAHAAEIARVVVAVAQAKAQPAGQGQGVDQRLQVVLAVRHRLGQLRWGVAGQDRKSVASGKSVDGRGGLGGRRSKKKNKQEKT